MTAVLLSANAYPELRSYLANSGYTIRTFPELNTVSHIITNRPDVLISSGLIHTRSKTSDQ